jgi:hypothetical protein
MVEQPVHHTTGEVHKHHERRLSGARLWLARGCYFILFSLVLIFFGVGFRDYLDWWNRGAIGLAVRQNQNGSLIASLVDPNGDAGSAGVRVGDTLLAVNGIRVSSEAQANQALVGKIGDPVTITVQTGSTAPRQVSLVYAGRFLQLLANLHLSVRFLFIYNMVFGCLLALGVILSSPLVFLRRSNDWLVILVAFAMIAFASYLLSPVGFGAVKLKILFMDFLIYMVGMVTMIIVFLIYPSGHFEPHWTRWVSILLIVPAVLDFVNLETIHNSLLDFLLWIGFLAVGAFAQLYRYRRVSSQVERQQTKWVVFGAVACFLIIAILNLAAFLLSSLLPYTQYLLYQLLINVWATLSILVLDLSFVLAVYRYRLWDTDLYINRTLVYSLVTLFLMLVWVITTQVLNYASQQLFGKQVGWLGAILSSLQVAVIYRPVRKWVEKWVNNRFYKDRIDYSEALVELRPEMWTYLTPADLGHTLVTTVPALLQSTSGALFLRERHRLTLTEVHNLHPSDAYKFHFSDEAIRKLENANVLSLPEGGPFAILVPLTVSRLKVFDLVGILAIGPRPQGRGFSRDHLNDLSSLGRNAGTALYMLKLNEKKHIKEIPSRVGDQT